MVRRRTVRKAQARAKKGRRANEEGEKEAGGSWLWSERACGAMPKFVLRKKLEIYILIAAKLKNKL